MSTSTRITSPSRVFVARLVGTKVFDPLGDEVGRVRDVVVLVRLKGAPRAVGLVVGVGRRRVFLPLTRVTGIDHGTVITTGLVNLRRFEQRAIETLVMGELLDRVVTMKDGSGETVIHDVAIEQQRNLDWHVTKLFVRRRESTGLFRRGQTFFVTPDDVTGLGSSPSQQGATTLLASMSDMKPADLAEMLRTLPDERVVQVAQELTNERLADVLQESVEEDQVAILSALPTERAADILDEMEPDDAADLVQELPDAMASELLALMEPEEAADVRRLLEYGEQSAGGLMTTEPIVLGPEDTIAMALAHARKREFSPAIATVIFVTRPPHETPTGRILGLLHLQRALREPPHGLVGNFLDKDIEGVLPNDHFTKAARLMATYNSTIVPVLDEQRRLLGAVSVDDVLDEMLPENWRESDEDPHSEEAT